VNAIADYAVIGDCHSLALVGRDGSIDWVCFPSFDAPAQFCGVLDDERGGRFAVAPVAPQPSRRRHYLEDTNVLVTVFRVQGGELEVADCMTVAADPDDPTAVRSDHTILRRVRCTGGSVVVAVEISPRFEYGGFVPRFRSISPTAAEVTGGADALWVQATLPVQASDDAVRGDWTMHAGDEAWVAITWYPSTASPRRSAPVPPDRFAERLDETIRFWRSWMARCAYEGDHAGAVRRSALVLKALTYAPSGAVVAAGTTSLPEAIGGSRNWDYRYTWIRDATLTLSSLFVLGFTDEATAFKAWLERAGSGRPADLQIMYGIRGEHRLDECVLSHLRGHRGSAPVRIGNAAASQSQLDSFGQVVQAAYLFHRAGGSLTADNWRYLAGLADLAAARWREPDHGIWEMRDEPRHFVHSKVHCWLALDRAIRLAGGDGAPGVGPWLAERDAVRAYVLDEAAPHGWFRQAVGHDVVDASALVLPAVGFLPTSDPRVLRTIDVVGRDLERDGLVFRYLTPDGLEGGEGTFLLCSFWLLDCLTHAGRLDAAAALLERLVGLANDAGIFAEEIDPVTGEPLGNLPQAFSHMALVTSCSHLDAARAGRLPDGGAHDYAELALDRLLTRGPLAGPGPAVGRGGERSAPPARSPWGSPASGEPRRPLE
jgi:GH15 family glucan-1,4-alpha-glucosidase